MSINDILSLGKTALMANQTAIRTTSNNISNVNTEGYSRQRVVFNSDSPVRIGEHILGMGVEIEGIERIFDRFIQSQVVDAGEDMSMFDASYRTLSRLEAVFNEAKGAGLDDALTVFFGALQDVSTTPQSYAARSALLSAANVLADRINLTNSRVTGEINVIETELAGSVSEVNDITRQIADLNDRIHTMEGGGGQANSLRDQRDQLIRDLGSYLDITAITGSNGMIDVLTSGGGSLVAGSSSSSLSTAANADNHGYSDIMLGSVNITGSIRSGSMRGLLDVRDNVERDILDRLDRLSATLTKEFNVLHNAGFGLDSLTGLDLFNPLTPAASLNPASTGGAGAAASVLTLSAVTLDSYEIRFTGAATFNIRNTTTNTDVSIGNAYASGANIDFDGLRVVITDVTGAPAAGDRFSINITEGSAAGFGVALTDANSFAAATSSAALPGDNTNVLAMIGLGSSKVLSGGLSTFYSYYSAMVSDVGTATAFAEAELKATGSVLAELENYRESVSGVSMDEEGISLIKYQRAYEAAARIISTVDEMYLTLLNL
ncbi:MAG: flagellar hook-associated protein FlgK [Thermodesulfobacteriota bacterium]